MEDKRLLSSTYRTAVHGGTPWASNGSAAPQRRPPNVRAPAVQSEPCCPICLARDTRCVRPYRIGPTRPIRPFSELCIQQCMQCDVAFAYPSPTIRELDVYYAERYGKECSRRGVDVDPGSWDSGAARARAQMEFVSRYVQSTCNWLDIGAGYGLLLDEAMGKGAVTGAIEPDIGCGRKIRAKGHELYANLSAVPGVWDVVSLSHVLEHVAVPRQFIHVIRGLLSKDGHVFCEVPNETYVADAVEDIPHLVFFTERSLKRLFEESGMHVTAVTVCGERGAKSHWDGRMREWMKRLSRRFLSTPPKWLDRLVHPHFRYTNDAKSGAWIRLLARRQ